MCIIITYTIFNDENYYAMLMSYPKSELEVITKFVCALILHVKLQPKIQMGLNMMKFVANHRYRFSSPSLAFFTGMLVASIHMMLELLTLLVLTISFDALQIVINFMGLVAISEFEDYVASSVNIDNYKSVLLGEDFKKICLTIARTTSTKALKKRKEHRIQDIKVSDEELKKILSNCTFPTHIGITDRSW